MPPSSSRDLKKNRLYLTKMADDLRRVVQCLYKIKSRMVLKLTKY